jgi:hypothetical protein
VSTHIIEYTFGSFYKERLINAGCKQVLTLFNDANAFGFPIFHAGLSTLNMIEISNTDTYLYIQAVDEALDIKTCCPVKWTNDRYFTVNDELIVSFCLFICIHTFIL